MSPSTRLGTTKPQIIGGMDPETLLRIGHYGRIKKADGPEIRIHLPVVASKSAGGLVALEVQEPPTIIPFQGYFTPP